MHGAFCWLSVSLFCFIRQSIMLLLPACCHHKCFKFVFNRLLFKQNENLSLELIVLSNFHYHPKFNSFLSSTIGWKPHLHKTIHLRPRRIQKKELKCRDFYISLEIGVILVVQANFDYQKQDFDFLCSSHLKRRRLGIKTLDGMRLLLCSEVIGHFCIL